MPNDRAILELLRVLYSAPTEPERWNDFLRSLGREVGVTKAALTAHDIGRGDHRVLAGLGDELAAGGGDYQRHYGQHDRWVRSLRGMKLQIFRGEVLWPESDFFKSVFYNEFLKQYDISKLVGITYMPRAGVVDGVSLFRGHGEDVFGREEICVLETILPHLRTAFETRRKLLSLESRVTDLEAALDSLSSAMILVDVSGKVVFLNKQARGIVSLGEGLRLHRGRLTIDNAQQNAILNGLIARAVATSLGVSAVAGGAMPVPRSSKRPLHLLVSPIASDSSSLPARAAAAIFIDDPETQPLVPADVLRTLFGLTPAEARLALTILDGNSVSEAAELNGVTRETVKSQMKAVLAKTRTRRQGELIRMLSRLPGHRR